MKKTLTIIFSRNSFHNSSSVVKAIKSLFCLLLFTFSTKAQVADSTRFKFEKQSPKDSASYAKIKQKMSGGVKGDIWGLIFKDAHGIDTLKPSPKFEENPYKEHKGKVIRKIFIKNLDVFGGNVYDTLTRKLDYFEELGNNLHKETRADVIRNKFLLFKEGDIVKPEVLWETERLLRSTQLFADARILLIPPDSTMLNLVDALVITQDQWSLLPEINFSNFQNYSISLNQKNFKGLGNRFINTFYWNKGLAPSASFSSNYTIPSVWKNSYVTAQADLVLRQFYKYVGGRIYRPFISPDTKYAGSAEMSFNSYRFDTVLLNLRDKSGKDSVNFTSLEIPHDYFLMDIWAGSSFKVPFGDEAFRKRARFVITARSSSFLFSKRPQIISQDTNQIYQDRHEWLISFGFSDRSYVKDALIYGFGRTEDVPVGFSAALVLGRRNGEFTKANYLGIKMAKGLYINKKAYIYGLFNLGGFINQDGHAEQGVLSAESSYFSPLYHVRRNYIRNFFSIQYALGIKRYTNEALNINRENGFPDLYSEGLFGNHKLVFNAESVMFTQARFLGFRIAPFVFGHIGFINLKDKTLTENLYSGFGLGIRLRNDHLTFDTFQIRLGIYPNVPYINFFRPNFGSTPNFRLHDFDISAPEFVPFR